MFAQFSYVYVYTMTPLSRIGKLYHFSSSLSSTSFNPRFDLFHPKLHRSHMCLHPDYTYILLPFKIINKEISRHIS